MVFSGEQHQWCIKSIEFTILSPAQFLHVFPRTAPSTDMNCWKVCFQDTLHQFLSSTFNSFIFQQFIIPFSLHRSPLWLSDSYWHIGDSRKTKTLAPSLSDLECLTLVLSKPIFNYQILQDAGKHFFLTYFSFLVEELRGHIPYNILFYHILLELSIHKICLLIWEDSKLDWSPPKKSHQSKMEFLDTLGAQFNLLHDVRPRFCPKIYYFHPEKWTLCSLACQ